MTLSPAVRRMLPALLHRSRHPDRRRVHPGRHRRARARPRRHHAPPLTPATPGADPVSLLAWLFTPIFQVDVHHHGRGLRVPLQPRRPGCHRLGDRRTDARRAGGAHPALSQAAGLAAADAAPPAGAQGDPEAVQGRLDEGRASPSRSSCEERGVNALAGCLPLLLQLPLLFIMYSVIQNGLTNVDPSAMLTVFGIQVVPLTCTNIDPATGLPSAALGPCIETVIPIFGTSIDVSQPSTIFADRRLRHQHPGHRVRAPAARAVADDAAGRPTRPTTIPTSGSSAR